MWGISHFLASWDRNTNTADPDDDKFMSSTFEVFIYPGVHINREVIDVNDFFFCVCVCVTCTCPMLDAAMKACCTTLLLGFCSDCVGSELQSWSSRYCRISAWPLRAAWTPAHCPLLSTWSTWCASSVRIKVKSFLVFPDLASMFISWFGVRKQTYQWCVYIIKKTQNWSYTIFSQHLDRLLWQGTTTLTD